MSLLTKFLSKKDIDEYFLTLGIEEHRLSAAIAKISQNQITIIGTGSSEWSAAENEIEAADIAISQAEKNLKDDILVEKVIFGLPQTFLEGDKIKPDQMERMKKICSELALKPAGFIEYPQALAYYLERKEESRPTTFLLSVGKSNLIFSLIRVGRIEKNHIVSRSDSIIADFESALLEFKDEILPSRILLYDEADSVNMEKLKDELLSFPWSKHSSFLHTPKIEILPPSIVLTALVETVGGSMLKTLEIEELIPADNFGFVSEENIPVTTDKSNETVKEENIITPSNTEEEIIPKTKSNNKTVAIFNNLTDKFAGITLPSISIPMTPFGKLIPIIILLVLIGGSLAGLSYFYPKALIKLIVTPVLSKDQINVLITTDQSKLSSDKNTILAKEISEDVKEDKSTPATGKNKVGDAAKGEVIIYNKTQNSKTFPKGTVLLNGDLKFTLDRDVTVASASDTGEGLVFSKTAAQVTAFQIGPESNLNSGSNFTFKDFPTSSYYGKNTTALTGGSSREVSSVSKDDQDLLLKAATDELLAKAKQDIGTKLARGEKIIDGTLNTKITSRTFSKEVGSEARDVNLSLGLKITTLVYKEEDLITLAKNSSSLTKPGYKEDVSQKSVSITSIKQDKKGNIAATAVVNSFFIPDIDVSRFSSEVAGKSFEDTANRFKLVDNVSGVEITNIRSLPFLHNKLPYKSQNITINIVPR